jgi:hypothetical protein
MRKKQICLLIIYFNFFSLTTHAQLSGTYLIGPNAPKYTTINMAVQDLYLSGGVKGPVIFNIEDGIYEEQIYIPQINNTSVNNLVTFQSLSGDSSKVIIRFKPKNDTFNYTLMLDGANFLVFKKLTFATDTIFGRVIDINNQCSFNQFISNRITGMPGGKELIYSNSTTDSWDNYNRFDNNLFEYGSVGILFHGTDISKPEEGNEFLRNKFIDQSQQAIDLKYGYAFKIRNNTISTTAGKSDYTAIKIQNCKDKFYIEKNKIDINNQSQTCHGIAVVFCTGINVALASSISNNFIHIASNTYVYASGIDILGSYKNVYFNSVNLTGSNDASICFNEINATDINIYNNIFSNTSKGLSLVLNDTLNIECDYNNLFTNGIDLAAFGANYFTTLGTWNASTGFDQHSISTEPFFFSNKDLHIRNFRLSKRGKVISGVNDDIDGNGRKSPKPDIGADEFNYKLDLGPDRNICAGTSTTINAEKGFDTYLWHDGSTADTITVDSSDAKAGVLKVKLTVAYQTDHYSDSLLVHFIAPQASLGPNKAVCGNESVTLQATGGIKFKWNTGDTTSSINFTATKPAGYSVIVTDQYGCIDSASVWVSVKDRPVKPNIIQIGTDSLKSSIAGTTYKWFLNKAVLTDKTMIIKAKTSGIYQLMVADSVCYSDTSDGYDYYKNSMDYPRRMAHISVYPNPVSDILIINVSGNNLAGSQIEIISVLGKKVWHSDHINQRTEIATSAYEKGLYILRFSSGDQLLVRGFVIE